MMLINGEFKTVIDATDRGFQYGDGLFETIAVHNGIPVFFDQHLERLISGCQKLKIPSPDKQNLINEVRLLCSQVTGSAVLKIIVTRGSGGRGYKQPELISVSRVLTLNPYPIYPSSYYSNGINLCICQTQLGLNPCLAGIKHLNRLEQIMARAEWQDTDTQEGLLKNCNGYIIEGTMSNLFFVKNGQLYTSILNQSGVSGIIRGLVINIAMKNDLPITEKNIDEDELLNADEIFVCNSIIGIWPVKRLNNRQFKVGEISKKIQLWLQALQDENCSILF